MSAPTVFDRPLLARRRARALARRQPDADFLLERIVDDADDRLASVMRRFEAGIALGDPTGRTADMLRRSGKVATVVDAVPQGTPPRPGSNPTDLVVVDEEALPFRPGGADLIVAVASLHWVNDLSGTLAQIRHALAPDGLFLAALPGGDTLTELRQSLLAAEAEVLGGASPRVAPFVDVRDMGALLQRAGFALPVTDIDRFTVRYADLFGLIRDLRAMGATGILTDRTRRRTPPRVFFRAAEIYAARFSDPDGRIRATFEIVSASGWAPHPGQQKPARPGSAKVRLADALGTTEQPTGEKPGG